ncbi:MAG TPA: NifX-associated nitrogen fixation protein [Pseudonocardiaceae bacterium]
MTFLDDLISQLRAGDTYGQLDRLSDEVLLRPYLVSRERQRDIPIDCEVDAATEGRLRSFYQAVAAGIENATGVFTATVLDMSHEGFGRAIVLAGRLVVVADVLRDAQRFGFPTVEKLTAKGQTLVDKGAKLVAQYPEVARDDS